MKLLVLSTYPEKLLTHGQKTVGVASYTKNTLISMHKANSSLEIRVLADIIDSPEIYSEEGITVERLWKRKSFLDITKLFLKALFAKESSILIPFEVYMYGSLSHTAFYIFTLGLLRLMNKKNTLVLHHVIEDVSNFEKNTFKKWFLNSIRGLFYSIVLLTSEKVIVFEEEFKKRLGNKDKVVVVPHAVEERPLVSKEEARRRLNLDVSTKYALYFGYISPYKGVTELIDAWDSNQNIKLIIAGGGNPNHMKSSDYASFVNDVFDKAKSKGILAPGFIPQEEIYLYFVACDLLILPYKSFISSSGPLSFAFLSGLPVLFSDQLKAYFNTSDMSLALKNSGLLVEDVTFSFSKGNLFSKINNLLDNKDQFSYFSKKMAQARAWSKVGELYVEVVKKVSENFKSLFSRFLHLLRVNYPILVLALFTGFLFKANYVPGTFLSGWDNLHPEFNFKENIVNRALFGVWQEYQGLGVLAGNGHASDLFREVFLYFASFFMDPSLIRYFWYFLLLFIGSVGSFFLIKKLLLKPEFETKRSQITIAALAGSLFYLLNLGTMQNFYVPYEPFPHLYAFLPFMVLSFIKYLENPNKKVFWLLILVNVLAAPVFFTPTNFLVYLVILSILALFIRSSIKTIAWGFAIIFIVNAYWLFPFLYFVSKGTSVVTEAKINIISTEDAFLRNQEYGGIKDVALLRGFWFGTTDWDGAKSVPLMEPWIQHLNSSWVLVLGYSFFVLGLVGLLYAFYTKNRYKFILFSLFGISVFALMNANPPFGNLFVFFQQYLPLFKQIFRFPYTKFIVLASLSYSILAAFGFMFLSKISTNIFRKQTAFLFLIVFSCLLVLYAQPSFEGDFLYKRVKVTFPLEYTELFKFFEAQDSNTRIANLPQVDFWGWRYYDFGYRGSGFPWYGIRQPILDRAFDVWNSHNEEYYIQLSHSLLTQDVLALENTLQKYGVAWIWVDGRIISPTNPSLLHNAETENLLQKSSRIKKVFTTGKQTVYSFDLNINQKEFTSAFTELVPVASTFGKSYFDPAFSFLGNYYKNTKGLFYPFADIERNAAKYVVADPDITFSAAIQNDGVLQVPDLLNTKSFVLANATISKEPDGNSFIELTSIQPLITVNSKPVVTSSSAYKKPLGVLSATYLMNVNGLVYESPIKNEQVLIDPVKNNNISVFNNNYIDYDLLPNIYNLDINNCRVWSVDSTTLYGKNFSEGFLTLQGSNSRPCLYARLASLTSSNSEASIPKIVEVLIDIKTNSIPSKLTICLSKEGDYNCFFQKRISDMLSIKSLDNEVITYKAYIPLENQSFKDIWFKIELNADDTSIVSEANIKRLHIREYNNSLFSSSIDLKDFSRSKDAALEVKAGDKLEVTNFYKNSTLLKSAGFRAADIRNKVPSNCEDSNASDAHRIFNIDSEGNDYIEYSSLPLSSCDSEYLYDLTYNPGLILSTKTRTISGRPLQLCLSIVPSDNCVLFEILTSGSNWHLSNYVVPPANTGAYSYKVNLENSSYGRLERLNQFSRLSAFPFDYYWLKNISVIPNHLEVIGNAKQRDFNAKKHTVFWYSVALSDTSSESYIILNQSFEDGWIAIGSSKHFLANDWANGWVVPAGTKNITIFFWPQILEFIGLSLYLSLVFFSKKHLN